ncbi:MAG: acyl-CoA thioesterase, partial [Patescibacteria group bacterium]
SESVVECQLYEIFPSDLNSQNTMFGGRVMEITDKKAGLAAMLHARQQCVTAQVDGFRFVSPAKMGEVLIFKAAVNRVWCSSLEVGIKVLAWDLKTNAKRHVVSAYFTFVALGADSEGCKICLPEVLPETEDEKRRYSEAEERRSHRLREAGKIPQDNQSVPGKVKK